MLVIIFQLKVFPIPRETVGIVFPRLKPAEILVGLAVREGISVHT
jgi:hypothetical protein